MQIAGYRVLKRQLSGKIEEVSQAIDSAGKTEDQGARKAFVVNDAYENNRLRAVL